MWEGGRRFICDEEILWKKLRLVGLRGYIWGRRFQSDQYTHLDMEGNCAEVADKSIHYVNLTPFTFQTETVDEEVKNMKERLDNVSLSKSSFTFSH